MKQDWTDRESRSPTLANVTVRQRAAADLPAVITNISNRGCHIKSGESLTPGELVEIVVPRLGSLLASVRWTSFNDSGLEFVAPSQQLPSCPRGISPPSAPRSSAL